MISAKLPQFTLLLTVLLPATVAAQTAAPAASPKLDESLRAAVTAGCVGTQSVIIQTTTGYRAGTRASLEAHGDRVRGEFPALDAVVADVHCRDLATLAGFSSTRAVSINAPVGVQRTATPGRASAPALTVAQATAALAAAQQAVLTATQNLAAAQAALRAAQAALVAARVPVLVRQRPTVNTAAVAAATARVNAATAQVNTASARLAAAQQQVAQTTAQLAAAQAAAAQAAAQARATEGVAAAGLQQPLRDTLAVTSDVLGWRGPVAHGGAGVGVAVIDSGIAPGPDFGDRLTAFYDFTQGDIRAAAPSDGYGHGTHVAGLIASRYVGVAPEARLIGLKVLDAQGQGTSDAVMRAIEFAITNKTLLGIDVLNLSLGHPIFEAAATDPLVQAVEHAVRAGLVVVVSAGNFGINPATGQPGYAGIASPGNAPSAISVGAVRTFGTVTRADDRIAAYSSRGPSWYDGFAKPDVVAPGDNLLSVAAAGSTLRAAQEARGNTGNYMRLSGTSMAAGVASGVAVLVLEANRGLTPNALKAVLEYTALPVQDSTGAAVDVLTQGAGDLEVAGAVALARTIVPTAPVGQPWLTRTTAPATVIGNQVYAWGQRVIWGNHIARGHGILTEQRPAWRLNVVWGEALEHDDNIVWGNRFGDDDNIVWGNRFDAGDNIVWGNNIVWGASFGDGDNIVWGNSLDNDNIVWGNSLNDDNIVWGNSLDGDNIVWGNNIVWGQNLIGQSLDGDNIVWGNFFDEDNIVWGNLFDADNIVWGNSLDDDNIVWGNSAALGQILSGAVASGPHAPGPGRRSVSYRGRR